VKIMAGALFSRKRARASISYFSSFIGGLMPVGALPGLVFVLLALVLALGLGGAVVVVLSAGAAP
jgi:hypothetical protein